MITQRQIKHLVSLHAKKARDRNRTFLVQGKTMVHELLNSNWQYEAIFCLENEVADLIGHFKIKSSQVIGLSEKELIKVSTLKNPNKMLAEVLMKDGIEPDLSAGLHVYLEGVRDPGNLGTIIRISDQFGVSSILCSNDCVDLYNPKVVQSTMGSLFRVNVQYVERDQVSKLALDAGVPIVASTLGGEDLYTAELMENMVLALGSESHGLSAELIGHSNLNLTIPNYGNAESLNVAVAAAVFCSEYRARAYR